MTGSGLFDLALAKPMGQKKDVRGQASFFIFAAAGCVGGVKKRITRPDPTQHIVVLACGHLTHYVDIYIHLYIIPSNRPSPVKAPMRLSYRAEAFVTNTF